MSGSVWHTGWLVLQGVEEREQAVPCNFRGPAYKLLCGEEFLIIRMTSGQVLRSFWVVIISGESGWWEVPFSYTEE